MLNMKESGERQAGMMASASLSLDWNMVLIKQQLGAILNVCHVTWDSNMQAS